MNNYRGLIPSLLTEIEDIKDFFDVQDNFRFSNTGVSLYEDEKKIYVEAQMPGVKLEEIEITFDKGFLWIKADSSKKTDEEKKNCKYHMRASSSFSYRIAIPSRIDESKDIDASYKDGILKVVFEKSKKEQPKKIQIKAK